MRGHVKGSAAARDSMNSRRDVVIGSGWKKGNGSLQEEE